MPDILCTNKLIGAQQAMICELDIRNCKQDSRQGGTCLNCSFSTSNAVQDIIGANVAGQGLNGVLSKSCRASEVDQQQVVAQGDEEGVAREEGGGVARVGTTMWHHYGWPCFACSFVVDQNSFYSQVWCICWLHLHPRWLCLQYVTSAVASMLKRFDIA